MYTSFTKTTHKLDYYCCYWKEIIDKVVSLMSIINQCKAIYGVIFVRSVRDQDKFLCKDSHIIRSELNRE